MIADQGPYPGEDPVQFAVEYPDRPLNRLTSFFRIFVIIPILIVVRHRFWRNLAVYGKPLHHDLRRRGRGGRRSSARC